MKKLFISFVAFTFLLLTAVEFSSCKSCKKKEAEQTVPVDTLSAQSMAPSNMVNLPHADTSLIPVLAKVLDDAFAASAKKNYDLLGSLIVYRGPDEAKTGTGVFNAKNKFDKGVVRVTAEVFNKWNKDVPAPEYGRVFSLDLPDGSSAPVLEVIFASPKQFDRKFFIFLQQPSGWKIGDISSNIQ
jgi:hypothetical protein